MSLPMPITRTANAITHDAHVATNVSGSNNCNTNITPSNVTSHAVNFAILPPFCY